MSEKFISNPFATMPGFNCFACGSHNRLGLKLKFLEDGQGVRTSITPQDEYKGFADILHGGIQSTLLDEVMWWAAFQAKKLACLTQNLQIDFRGPIRVQEPLNAYAKVTNSRESGSNGRTNYGWGLSSGKSHRDLLLPIPKALGPNLEHPLKRNSF